MEIPLVGQTFRLKEDYKTAYGLTIAKDTVVEMYSEWPQGTFHFRDVDDHFSTIVLWETEVENIVAPLNKSGTKKCECGGLAVGAPGHSYWCKAYVRN